MHDLPFDRLAQVTATLPFALDDYDAAAATFARWRDGGGAADWDATVVWVYGYSYRTLYRRFAREAPAAASDVDALVDQTFMRLVKKLDTVRDPYKLPQFVSVACKRAMISYRLRSRPTEALDAERWAAPPGPDDLDGPLVRWTFERAIDALPPALRVVARMKLLDGAEYPEIGEATGHPLPTVRTYLSKALVKIRDHPAVRALAHDVGAVRENPEPGSGTE